jgi:hypothetical protein
VTREVQDLVNRRASGDNPLENKRPADYAERKAFVDSMARGSARDNGRAETRAQRAESRQRAIESGRAKPSTQGILPNRGGQRAIANQARQQAKADRDDQFRSEHNAESALRSTSFGRGRESGSARRSDVEVASINTAAATRAARNAERRERVADYLRERGGRPKPKNGGAIESAAVRIATRENAKQTARAEQLEARAESARARMQAAPGGSSQRIRLSQEADRLRAQAQRARDAAESAANVAGLTRAPAAAAPSTAPTTPVRLRDLGLTTTAPAAASAAPAAGGKFNVQSELRRLEEGGAPGTYSPAQRSALRQEINEALASANNRVTIGQSGDGGGGRAAAQAQRLQQIERDLAKPATTVTRAADRAVDRAAAKHGVDTDIARGIADVARRANPRASNREIERQIREYAGQQ